MVRVIDICINNQNLPAWVNLKSLFLYPDIMSEPTSIKSI